jgi:inorganic triphosphatase YgiF
MKALDQTHPAPSRLVVAPPPLRIKPEGREIELKFFADEGDFKATQQWAALGGGRRAPAQRLRTVYFDTDARDLWRHRMFLRVRALRSRYAMALKWNGSFPGGHFERGEVEVAMRTPDPDPALLGEQIVGEIMRVTEGRPLQPFFATDIRRVVHRVRVETSEIEVAFDTGFIVAGEQKSPVREIELELKSGDPADLYRLGLSLAEAYPVRLGIMSKSERGVMLSSGTQPTAIRAAAPLTTEQTVDEAIGALFGSCIDQFIANWPAFEAGNGTEPVHQMRVAMRRFRSLLALFNRAFPCAEFVLFRLEAKRIASAMGEARNWDVFADLVRDGPHEAFPSEPGFEALLAATNRRRDAGYETVRALLADAATTRFVLSVQAFVARRGWRNALPGAELPRLTGEASAFAVGCLDRLHRRVRKRGRKLLELPAAERHEVRIALKNLRYAADAFAGLFGEHAGARPYTRAVAKLQDALGSYNDMQMTIDLAGQLDMSGDLRAARAVGTMIGWYGRGALVGDATLHTAWTKFRNAEPFWRRGAAES